MNWKIKAFLHWTISYLPMKENIAYFFQKYVIKTIPRKTNIRDLYLIAEQHLYYNDTNISRYNFLKYSDTEWTIYNPPSHYQNRLRHRDYLELFKNSNFAVLFENRLEGNLSDLEFLRTMEVSKDFKKYDLKELAVHSSFFTLKKI